MTMKLLQCCTLSLLLTVIVTLNTRLLLTDEDLTDPLKLTRTYSRYLSHQGKALPSTRKEMKVRLGLFKQNVALISQQNSQKNSYKLGVNQFTDLSNRELQQYHGLNSTLLEEDAQTNQLLHQVVEGTGESTVDWVSRGYVTPAKDQGRCGSCWAFGAVVALEGAYKKATDVLKDFAEQEYLDCVFTTRDGCTGGATHRCFQYNEDTGHMASQSTYPYTATDADRSVCDLTKYKNSLIAAKVTGRVTVRHKETEENTIKLLSMQPITLFIEATRTLHSYEEGILLDRTCWSQTNHAVAGVGYTPTYIIMKNSWGADWGESGFFKLLRGASNCGLYLAAQYPIFTANGEEETEKGAKSADYDHLAIVGPDPPKPDPDCDNAFGDFYCDRMTKSSCHNPQMRDVMCRKACNNCWIE